MTTDKSPDDKESRERFRVVRTAALRVKQLTYPMPTGPGEAGVLRNLSEEGICFSLKTPYAPKDQLCLSIDLMGWQHHKKSVALLVNENLVAAPLTAIAEVAWCRKLADENRVEIGARFVDIFEDDLKALKTYLTNVQHSLENSK